MNVSADHVELRIGSSVALVAELPALLRDRCVASATRRPAASPVELVATPRDAPRDEIDPADWADVRASLDGDGQAYARLVRRYQNQIAVYMWRFTRDGGQREELVHDVFVEAYLSLHSFQGRAPLIHWLRRIATRVGYRWWKRRDRQRAEIPLSIHGEERALAGDDDESAASDAGAMVHVLLARLKPRDRLVLTLMYLEECSVAEAAQRTGWSQSMVKVQAHRARKRLKKLCEQLELEP